MALYSRLGLGPLMELLFVQINVGPHRHLSQAFGENQLSVAAGALKCLR